MERTREDIVEELERARDELAAGKKKVDALQAELNGMGGFRVVFGDLCFYGHNGVFFKVFQPTIATDERGDPILLHTWDRGGPLSVKDVEELVAYLQRWLPTGSFKKPRE